MLLKSTSKRDQTIENDFSPFITTTHVQHQQNKMADEQFGAKNMIMAGKGTKTTAIAAKLNIPIKLVSYLDRYKFVI